MQDHLRTHFPAETAGFSSAELQEKISAAIGEAESHGLFTRQDLCRFLNLSVYLGWGFLSFSENAWMRSKLEGPPEIPPGERLKTLQGQVLFRLQFQQDLLNQPKR
jgi:hypothetical protein